MRRFLSGTILLFIAVVLNSPVSKGQDWRHTGSNFPTTTPIKYLVVIFDENISFDHYFATYPTAYNPPGEPSFVARPGTPAVNGLTSTLLNNNPNNPNPYPGDATPAAPFRLDRSEAVTCDNDNHYTDEQNAYDGGLLNKFAEILSGTTEVTTGVPCTPNLSMGYYDGNTVTAIWNYAQHYAMSDNNFGSTFGVTVMGHQNLIAGTTNGATPSSVKGTVINGSIIKNIDPLTTLDDCATTGTTNISMSGTNIGNLLNNKGVTWGWFYGDWIPTGYSGGIAQCVAEYDSHYTPFQYFPSTANPHHFPPTSVAAIGQTDQANHQYGMTDFWNAVNAGNIPAVSFIKPPANQTGHPATSSPLEEQEFLVSTINQLQATPQWREMAIIITYDDSDGWYDHVMPPIVSQSADSANDALLGSTGLCGTTPSTGINDRCGYGPRLPLIVISPFAKENFVSHSLTDQTSITRFAEDNWGLGQLPNPGAFDAVAGSILDVFDFSHVPVDRDRTLILDPDSGEPVRW